MEQLKREVDESIADWQAFEWETEHLNEYVCVLLAFQDELILLEGRMYELKQGPKNSHLPAIMMCCNFVFD